MKKKPRRELEQTALLAAVPAHARGGLGLAVSGLLCVGGGLSLFGHAIERKLRPRSRPADWFWAGTLSLALVNAGLCLAIEGSRRANQAG